MPAQLSAFASSAAFGSDGGGRSPERCAVAQPRQRTRSIARIMMAGLPSLGSGHINRLEIFERRDLVGLRQRRAETTCPALLLPTPRPWNVLLAFCGSDSTRP